MFTSYMTILPRKNRHACDPDGTVIHEIGRHRPFL